MSDRSLMGRLRDPPVPPTPILVCSKAVFCIMPIVQIAIGAVHLEDCPKQHYIPIYLVVMGAFGLMLAVLACLPCAQTPKDDAPGPLNRICTVWNTLVSFFLSCWFITGNVWIYSIYEPNYNKTTTLVDPYCDKTVYLFAFWTTTLVYIFLCLFLFVGCCVLVCFFIFGRADADDDNI